jgi:hypothetical protein
VPAEFSSPVALVAEVVTPGQHAQREAVQYVLLGKADRSKHLMGDRRPFRRRFGSADLGGCRFQERGVIRDASLRQRVGGGGGHCKRCCDLAGEPRQVLLHRLEFADRPLEGDALVGVGDAQRQYRFQYTGSLDAADRRAHQQQGSLLEMRGRRRAAQRSGTVEGHDVGGVAGEIAVVGQPAILSLDKGYHRLAAAIGKHGDLLRLAGERYADRAAAECAARIERDAFVRTHRSDGHRRQRRFQAGARQKPAGRQCFGERHRERKTPGHTEHRKAVSEARARAAQIFRDPRERQSGVAQRVP